MKFTAFAYTALAALLAFAVGAIDSCIGHVKQRKEQRVELLEHVDEWQGVQTAEHRVEL